jgi:4-hydroxythreonine-4-phosphate dehydrogenase
VVQRDFLPLLLSIGDPAGCGPQITSRAWQALKSNPEFAFAVISHPRLHTDVPVAEIGAPREAHRFFADALPVLTIDIPHVEPGQPDPATAPATLASIAQAVQLVRQKSARAIVTNPISKHLLYQAGFKHAGHTEYLAELCTEAGEAPPFPVMMLVGGGLRVALATIHLPLKEVSGALSLAHLVRIASIVHTDIQRRFGLAAPRLVFTGLNPHAGEAGSMGREEIDIINPAATSLRAKGIDIADARPADTVFAEALSGHFDAVIAMTHDQGLIPVKTLDLWGGVNVTLGLPIVRTSPDHGTAYDAASAGTAKPDSLIAAIRLAHEMTRHDG